MKRSTSLGLVSSIAAAALGLTACQAIADNKAVYLMAVGGSAYLVAQANSNPQAFMALLGKILPKDMTFSGPDGGAVVIKRIIIDPKAPDSAERIRDRHPDAEGVPPGA